jgi:hypothetical protein
LEPFGRKPRLDAGRARVSRALFLHGKASDEDDEDDEDDENDEDDHDDCVGPES